MASRAPRSAVDELPLDLSDVLDEEFSVLCEEEGESALLPGWLLTEEQLAGPVALEDRLRARTAVAAYFRAGLSEDARRGLDSGEPPAGAPVKALLVRDLNRLLEQDGLLYDETRLADVGLDRRLRALTGLRLAADAQVRVNRLLLECAFPGSIERIDDIRLRAMYARIHARGRASGSSRPRTALCLSGGGIRSATFGLGVLQGLARHDLLGKLDYLSTVSGGGYVGAWLTSWIHRHRDGTRGVTQELANDRPRSPVAPEPRPVHHLREYSNYLSPQLGFLSADTWALVGTYLRNLLLNWTVLIPLFLGALAIPRFLVSATLSDPGHAWRLFTVVVGLLGMLVAVVYIGLFRPSLEEHRRRLPSAIRRCGSQVGFLGFCLAPIVVSALALTTYWAWPSGSPPVAPGRVVVGLMALAAGLHVLSWLIHSLVLRRFHLGELSVTVATGVVAGLIVGLVATKVLPAAPVSSYVEYYVPFAAPAFLGAFLLAATVFVGLMSRVTTDEDREWWARSGSWTLVVGLAWTVVCALVILGPAALLYSWTLAMSTVSLGTIAGAVAVLLGRGEGTSAATTATISLLKDRAASLAAPVALVVLVALLSLTTTAMLPIVAPCRDWPVIAPPFPMLPDRARHGEVLHCTPVWLIASFSALLVGLALLASRLINVNKFSLHAMYRARLIRAYLGASREGRNPNPFTGFDPLDNVSMHQLRDEAFNLGSFRSLPAFVGRLQRRSAGDAVSAALFSRLSTESRRMIDSHVAGTEPSSTLEDRLQDDLNLVLDTVELERDPPFRALAPSTPPPARPGRDRSRWNRALLEAAYPDEIVHRASARERPLHVLNIALNLVGGGNLAWQERKAETFTVSELHSGSYHVGYRRSNEYGGARPRGISLGTAVAISGAAASPNMGYNSSPIVTLLMTLFNARLGWWLGNPGPNGQATFSQNTPRVGVWPIIREAAGLTDDEYRYVYLSDGGHFDNLGLLEMVLRRCHLILVSDAGCDPKCTFDDLGNAIRKVRVDLGVPITVDQELRFRARATAEQPAASDEGAYFAIATIRYSEVDAGGIDGKLVYVKPAFYQSGNEPVDVLNYALAHEAFPHESTGDQFFGESQFESYRALGLHSIERVIPHLPTPGHATR